MAHPTAPARWRAVRAALRSTADDFAALIRSVPDPAAPATADWSIAETAAHVTTVAMLASAVARRVPDDEVASDLLARAPGVTVGTVGELNEIALRLYRERDPGAIADRLTGTITALLASTAHAAPDTPCPWLGGARLPVAGLLAHLLNEAQIHGRDIARATGLAWSIPPVHAAHFFELFLLGMLRYDPGRFLDPTGPVPAGRVAVRFGSAFTSPATLSVRDGRLSIADADHAPDVRVRFDPTTLNLMIFGRIGRARAVLGGGIRFVGRRPWRLLTFLDTAPLPNRRLPRTGPRPE